MYPEYNSLIRDMSCEYFLPFCDYFLPFCGLSFYFLYGIFRNTKVFHFKFIYFYFCHLSFCVIYEKVIPNPRSQWFTPIFASKSFITFALTFRSMNYFELICTYGTRKGFNFILLYVDIKLSLAPFVEKTTLRMGENICKRINGQRINLQNI